MAAEKPEFIDSLEVWINKGAKESLKRIESEVQQEQKTLLHLAYLTTLARLPENRDLDELFDGEVQLWEEEMFAIYSLIEVVNWSNSISNLKAPKEMELEWNYAQDYSYEIDYDEYFSIDGKILSDTDVQWLNIQDKQNVKRKKVIKSVKWDGSLPANETNLIFNYDWDKNISGVDFERPYNFNEGWWMWIDQKIALSRNNKWLVDKMSVMRDFEIDNSISISYNSIWKPELLEQTKLWLTSDKIIFEYSDAWDLIAIIYTPALSLKHIKWMKKAYKAWAKTKWILKWIKLAWEHIAFETLKKMKWNDVIIINNENW